MNACPDGCYKHRDPSGNWVCCKCGTRFAWPAHESVARP